MHAIQTFLVHQSTQPFAHKFLLHGNTSSIRMHRKEFCQSAIQQFTHTPRMAHAVLRIWKVFVQQCSPALALLSVTNLSILFQLRL